MKKDSGSSDVGIETGTSRGTTLREVAEQGLPRSCFKKRPLSTQEAKTTLVGESPFSDLHAAKIMTNSV